MGQEVLMTEVGINYLFPPDKIHELPTWQFILHFQPPLFFRGRKVRKAIEALRQAEWKVIQFRCDLEELAIDPESGAFSIPIEVPEERRGRSNSLSKYESDFWKICGNVQQFGFGSVYYEAVGWQE